MARKRSWSQIQRGLIRRINRFRPFRPTTIDRLATSDPTCWQPVYPAWHGDWPEQLPSGPLPPIMSERLSRDLPARGVLRLHHASILGDHGWIFTRNGRLVIDTSNFVDAASFIAPVYRPLFGSGACHLRGRTLSLLSNWAASNFYHMQMDVIPRVDLLFQAGWRWTDFDQILLPKFLSRTIERQLTRLALPMAKVIPIEWGPLNFFKIDELVCTSFPGGRRSVLSTTIDYLKQVNRFDGSLRPNRRLFVQRRGQARHLRNEPELLPLLQARGFELIDPGAHPHAETVFHEAAVVVGAHGAALANLVFCQPGTKVLELIPSDQAYPFFYTIAVQTGLIYDCLIGPSDRVKVRPAQFTWNSASDFTVDVDAVVRSLDRLLT